MTTIDKIRAEIERRIKSIDSCPFIEAEFGAEVRREGKLQAYKDIFSFLGTLEEPVSDCHELEDEISRTYRDGSVTDTSDIDHVAYENIASHFAEWGAEHYRDSTKTTSDDLEEAAGTHVKNKYCLTKLLGAEIQEAVNDFKAGAEWQARQLLKSSPLPEDTVLFNKGVEEGKRLIMEGAAEGEVVKDISNKLAVTAKNINLDGFRFGDNVKIIIVKEDKK